MTIGILLPKFPTGVLHGVMMDRDGLYFYFALIGL